MSDKIEQKILTHISKENHKLKKEIKMLEKRFETFTKFNKRAIERLEKKIKKLENKKK